MIGIIIGVIIAAIVIIILIVILAAPTKTCKKTEVADNSSDLHGWRVRWFLISGDKLSHPFEWILVRIPERTREKIRKLLDNKLKYYRRQINFESETDLNESVNTCTKINDKLSVLIPLQEPDQFKTKMNAFDQAIIEQHRLNINKEFQQSNEKFSQGCTSITEIVALLPPVA